ncbi:hypothetical protein WJX77_005516 [Trebouxia sp. C0004]
MEDHGVSLDTIDGLKDLTRDQGEALVKRFMSNKRSASQMDSGSIMAASSQTSTAAPVQAARGGREYLESKPPSKPSNHRICVSPYMFTSCRTWPMAGAMSAKPLIWLYGLHSTGENRQRG